jgi:hypothetical protein
MRHKALYLFLGISLLANVVVVPGVVAALASRSASSQIASRLHLGTRTQIRNLVFAADDLDSRVSDLESSVGDTSSFEDLSSQLDDLGARIDDLETGAGDEADQSVSDLSSAVDDLTSCLDDICAQFSYGC